MPQDPNGALHDALQRFHHLPDDAGVRLPVAKAVLGCSTATVWRLAKAGAIRAIKISDRVTVFQVGSLRRTLAGMEANHAPA